MRLLVVEDEPRVRSFVRRGLQEAGFAVDECASGHDALRLAKSHAYDAIVLDLRIPGRSGLEVLGELRREHRCVPVLVVTALGDVGDRVRGLDAGADDYLVKPFAFTELLARLRALLRRGTAQTSVIEVGDLRVDLVQRRAERAGVPIELTAKEFALLEYLARNEGQVVTRAMIAEHVWDTSFEGFTNVVDVHIRHLRHKVDEPFATSLIHTRRGFGYVLTPAP